MWILFFIFIPLVDLFLLIKLAGIMGFVPTVLLVILTGITGWRLLKSQGISVWARGLNKIQAGEMPENELLEGFVLVGAGALLITPGIITDIAGLSLLVPFIRMLIVRFIKSRFKSNFHVLSWHGSGGTRPDGKVVDGTWEEENKNK